MFEKVTRQVINRIDELEDDLRQESKSSSAGGTGGHQQSPSAGGTGFPSAASAVTALAPVIEHQIADIKKDIHDLRLLITRMAKKLNEGGGGGGGGGSKQPPQLYPDLTADTMPPLARLQPPPGRAQTGYITDPEGGGGGGRRRRGRGGRKGASNGYESDGAGSVYSEAAGGMQMNLIRRQTSPGNSVKSMPTGNKKRQRRKQLTGSWEDIKSEFVA